MNVINHFDISMVKPWKIVIAVTSPQDYEMDRVIFVEHWPDYNDYLLVTGSHCSCYDFDDTSWDGMECDRKELHDIVYGWLEHGVGSEKLAARQIIRYFGWPVD